MPKDIHYDCPSCHRPLSSSLSDAVHNDACPICGQPFQVLQAPPAVSKRDILVTWCIRAAGLALCGVITATAVDAIRHDSEERREKGAAGWLSVPHPNGGEMWIPPLDVEALEKLEPQEYSWDPPVMPPPSAFFPEYTPEPIPSASIPGFETRPSKLQRDKRSYQLDPSVYERSKTDPLYQPSNTDQSPLLQDAGNSDRLDAKQGSSSE